MEEEEEGTVIISHVLKDKQIQNINNNDSGSFLNGNFRVIFECRALCE